MAGKRGRSGRKPGSTNEKFWREALLLAVNRKDPKGRVYLARIAEACVKAALAGNMQAIKEIGVERS
jgi:hypothetical protein